MIIQSALFIAFLCWGSFLNVVGYRLIKQEGLLGRSACPHCKHTLAWYDLIPVLSYIMLKAHCRYCKSPISLLYPLIELITALSLSLLFLLIEPNYWPAYFLYFSALIVTIRTDSETMLISRYVTWALIPFGLALSLIHALPISIWDSFLGAIFGYTLLWAIARLFYKVRGIEGMGEGDFDLLAFIGSFTGLLGTWVSLFLGALFGSIAGIILLSRTHKKDTPIPFGPWLALGSILYVLFQSFFVHLF